MKKLFTTVLVLSICFSSAVLAQQCTPGGSTPVNNVGFSGYGFSPGDTDLPCMAIGSYVSDTLYYHSYDSITIGSSAAARRYPVNSILIDSIYLPAGLCWESNLSSNSFGPGAFGAFVISGTPTGPPGQYKLRIIANITYSISNTLIAQLSDKSMETEFGLRYDLRVTCASASCPAVNTTDTIDTYIAYPTCSSLTATITPADTALICSGGSVRLTADSAAGYTFRWSSGQATRSISASVAGPYTVTVYSGGDTAISAPTVVALSVPDTALTLSGPVSFCTGDSVTITAASGLSYLWSTQSTTQSITIGATGIYTVTVTDSTPCSAVSRPISVIAGTASAAITRTGTDTLTASAGVSYQWYRNGSLLSQETTQTIVADSSGIYYVIVTAANTCTAQSAPDTVALPSGIVHISSPAPIRLYPNPAGDMIYMSCRPGTSYAIIDILGETLLRGVTATSTQAIDISALPPGMYFINQMKFVKER